jgi:hypothetical protein
MLHAKTFRTVGESLESLGVLTFILEKAGPGVTVRTSDPLDPSKLAKANLAEKVWEIEASSRRQAKLFREDGALHYDASYVSWLDAQAQRKRRNRFSAQASGTKSLPQLMRSLGRHLDRVEPHKFRISWGNEEVHLDYQLSDGSRIQEVLSIAKLHELTMSSRHRRMARK